MRTTRALLLTALGVLQAASCNALLSNDPRHLATAEAGAGGQSGAAIGERGGDRGDGGATSGNPAGAAPVGGAEGPTTPPAGGEAGAGPSICDGCDPAQVPRDALLLWFMADQGVSVTGDRLTAWVEQSTAHLTASPPSEAAAPRRVAQASGPPMVEFDGADDGLKLPEGFSSFSGASFFAVAEAYAASGCAGILSLSNGDDADDIEFGRHTTNLLYYEVLGEWVEGAVNAFEANKRLLVAITQQSSGAVELRINGVVNASPKTIALPKAVVRRQNFLGRDTYKACPQGYKGLLGELVLFNRGVSAEEYAKIQRYLAAKWSIPVASP